MSGSPFYRQAIIESLERDYRNMITAGDSEMDSYVSYFWHAFDHCGEFAREPALRMLREAAALRADERARGVIHAMIDQLEKAPVKVEPEPPPPPPPTRDEPLWFSRMKPGERFRVLRSFTDFDGQSIEQGRVLTFRSYNYFHYDGGYTLYFEEGVIRLAGIDTANRELLENLEAYLERAAESEAVSATLD